ncbi:MAG: hypothetical protein K0Q73_508 [Paenibacillus sp.]|nr:hypothetical protein [Paenibacillus sp.]
MVCRFCAFEEPKKRAESAFLALLGGVEVCYRAESAEKALKVEGLEFLRMLGVKKRVESAFLALSGGVEVCFRAESAETALKVVSLEFLCMLGAE